MTDNFEQNVADCREIGKSVFADPWVGERTDIVYSPLQRTSLDPHSQYFLRMSSKFDQGKLSAGIEFVEHFRENGSEKVWTGYAVDDEDSLSVDTSDIPRLDRRIIDMPYMLYAPQINNCLDTFRNPDQDTEIDPRMLLDEIKIISDPEKVQPHISTKIAREHPVDEYSLDCLYKVHNMPAELADTISLRPRLMELLVLTARYKGKITLKATMLFNPSGELKGVSSNIADDPIKQIGALASFKRAVLN